MIQFGVLGVYAVILVAGMIVERRRPRLRCSAPGATSWHLIAMGLVEGLRRRHPAAIVRAMARPPWSAWRCDRPARRLRASSARRPWMGP
jgi:hypothetical protein